MDGDDTLSSLARPSGDRFLLRSGLMGRLASGVVAIGQPETKNHAGVSAAAKWRPAKKNCAPKHHPEMEARSKTEIIFWIQILFRAKNVFRGQCNLDVSRGCVTSYDYHLDTFTYFCPR